MLAPCRQYVLNLDARKEGGNPMAAPLDVVTTPRDRVHSRSLDESRFFGRISQVIAPYLVLCKLRVVSLVIFTGFVALAVAGGADLLHVLLFLVGGSLTAAGAAAFNHYFDRDIDARMERTQRRPLPAGQLSPHAALAFAVVIFIVGLGLLLPLGWNVIRWTLFGGVMYAAVYTIGLKRRHHWNIVIGGWTGSCAVLGGWQAAGAELTLTAWALAAIVFFWTPAHFWGLAIRRIDDYARAGVPMLPVVKGVPAAARSIAIAALLTVLVSLVPVVDGGLGLGYGAIALIAGIGFGTVSLRVALKPEPGSAWTAYKLSGLYLFVLFLAMLIGFEV